jgi:hypothetical protein
MGIGRVLGAAAPIAAGYFGGAGNSFICYLVVLQEVLLPQVH